MAINSMAYENASLEGDHVGPHKDTVNWFKTSNIKWGKSTANGFDL
jgi:hypothetical protein